MNCLLSNSNTIQVQVSFVGRLVLVIQRNISCLVLLFVQRVESDFRKYSWLVVVILLGNRIL